MIAPSVDDSAIEGIFCYPAKYSTSTTEHDKIKTSVDTIKTRLSYYFGTTVTEKKVFGS